jgi:hypothetical protein
MRASIVSMGVALSLGAASGIDAQLPGDWIRESPLTEPVALSCANRSRNEWHVEPRPDGSGVIPSPARSERTLRLELQDGVISGWNSGEFGGGLRWRTTGGPEIEFFSGNPIAIEPHRNGPIVVEGIAHLSINQGRVAQFERYQDAWRVSNAHELQGAPTAVLRPDAETLIVLTTTSLEVVDLEFADHRVIHVNENWAPLYASSLTRAADSYFIGGRHYIIEVSQRGEFWWSQTECR